MPPALEFSHPGSGRANALAWSRDGRPLAASFWDGVYVWAVRDGNASLVCRAPCDIEEETRALAFAPDGRCLATITPRGGVEGEGVELFDATSGASLRKLGRGGASSLAFSSGGDLLAIGFPDDAPGHVQLHRVSDGKLVRS